MIDAGHTSTNHAMDHININDDLFYSCSADSVSEQEVVEDLNNLNNLVNDLSFRSLIEPKTKYCDINLPPALDSTLLDTILKFELNARQAREYVSVYRLRDAIFRIIHDNYFRSEFYFSGVPSDTCSLHFCLQSIGQR